MVKVSDLKVQIYADGADKKDMLELYKNPLVKGFTTNPSLMKKAGVSDYKTFALELLKEIPDRGISFEVFADELSEMEKQALEINSWGKNVYVKIPVTNTKKQSTAPIISNLSAKGVKLNITAIFTLDQVRDIVLALKGEAPAIISVFAGRIADTGRNPIPIMKACSSICKLRKNSELLWASTRELYNIFEADESGCDIITVTPDVIKKLNLVGKGMDEYSLETVKMFYDDATKAGFKI